MLSAESEASFTHGAAERQRASGWNPTSTYLFVSSLWLEASGAAELDD